jgi:hypothetical protein
MGFVEETTQAEDRRPGFGAGSSVPDDLKGNGRQARTILSAGARNLPRQSINSAERVRTIS